MYPLGKRIALGISILKVYVFPDNVLARENRSVGGFLSENVVSEVLEIVMSSVDDKFLPEIVSKDEIVIDVRSDFFEFCLSVQRARRKAKR